MLPLRVQGLVPFLFVLTSVAAIQDAWAQESRSELRPVIPRTWDDAAMATIEVPLANPIGSPKHVFADYYYKTPLRPVYKNYPVYAPGHEPAGYLKWLKQQEPVVIWDGSGHHPALETEADWIKAGEIVFDSPVTSGSIFPSASLDLYVTEPEFYRKTGTPVAADGTVPFYRYVIEKRGEVKVEILGCAMCHTRVMPDGAILKGAQGNFPFDRVFAYHYRYGGGRVDEARTFERELYAVPWLAAVKELSMDEIASAHEAIPPGVLARHRASPLFPVQVPDLIGVQDRHYLDRTGPQQQRSIVDLMRYAALNQGADDLASYDGFIPAAAPEFSKLPEPSETFDRFSDEQLYALAIYL